MKIFEELAFYVFHHCIEEHQTEQDDEEPHTEMTDLIADLIKRVE